MVARVSGTTEGGYLIPDERELFSPDQTGLLDAGLNAQMAVTSSVAANLAINPDFSQVEANADQLDYNLRFPLTLIEKRPFFLEGLQSFDTPVPLFYSRGSTIRSRP